jgi:hypothetical protein
VTEEEGILILLRFYRLRRVLPLRKPFDVLALPLQKALIQRSGVLAGLYGSRAIT